MEAQAKPSNAATTVVETQLEGMDRRVIELLDGNLVVYRPIQPEDAHALQQFHHRLSPHSVYLRFFGAMPELSERNARMLNLLRDLGLPERLWIEEGVENVEIELVPQRGGKTRGE